MKPLVLLHGFMGTPATFRQIEEALDRPLFSPDLTSLWRQSDGSSGPERALDRLAHLVLADLSDRGVDRFDLLGYSLGGRVAMHLLKSAPDRVDRLILESAHPGLESEAERAARRTHDAAWAQRMRSEWPDVLSAWYDQAVFSSLPDSLRGELIREKQGQDPAVMADMLEGLSLGRQEPLWSVLADGASPILFISGEMDQRYQAIGERLAALSGPIRAVTLQGAGHVVHREQPGTYLGALRSFL